MHRILCTLCNVQGKISHKMYYISNSDTSAARTSHRALDCTCTRAEHSWLLRNARVRFKLRGCVSWKKVVQRSYAPALLTCFVVGRAIKGWGSLKLVAGCGCRPPFGHVTRKSLSTYRYNVARYVVVKLYYLCSCSLYSSGSLVPRPHFLAQD